MSSREKASAADWGEAYQRLRPVLFGVLRRLARQGFVMTAGQGLDFVHDFFVEAWPAVAKSHNPELGSLESYVGGAFARFVRPRLVREARWRAALDHDPDVGATADGEGGAGREVDENRVRQVLSMLEEGDRHLLLGRFGPEPVSERALASRLGTTRHRIRERLARALARLAAQLGERGILPELDFKVAKLLFIEECSIPLAAASLALTEPQIRAARRRVLTVLGRAAGESVP